VPDCVETKRQISHSLARVRDDTLYFFAGLKDFAQGASRCGESPRAYFCDFRNRATSRAAGIEGCAPLRVTEIAATAEA
jgi:hypothetical protein